MVNIKKILCAVDFSEMSPQVAAYAQVLAKCLNAEVDVVFVASTLERYRHFDVPAASFQNLADTIARESEKMMDKFIKENFSIANVRGKILKGYADEEILGFARKENVDLIILGTHGKKKVDKVFFGSVAEKVIKASEIPVLTIRPK